MTDIPTVRRSSILRLGQACLLLAVLTGCTVATNDGILAGAAISVNSGKDANVAEVPWGDLPTSVAVLPFMNKTSSDFAYTVVRRTMFNHFSSKNYRMLHWQDVDRRLALAGVDTAEEASMKTVAELTQILGVDGLLFGNITHYNKTFAGIASAISVGVELRFANADDKTLWEVKNVQRSFAGGVSTSPIGIIMNALVAAKHLHGDINLYRTAEDLGRELAAAMPEPSSLAGKTLPVILDVVHSGVGQTLKYGDTLEVGLRGDPGLTAAAVVDGIGVIDLVEVEKGEYVGKRTLDKALNVSDQSVTGHLQGADGQMVSWVSPYGLLNIDNLAPNRVTNLAAESRDGALFVSWRPPSDRDIAGYQVALAASETGTAGAATRVANATHTIGDLSNFKAVHVVVSALDHAGNVGKEVRLTAAAAPDARYATAAAAASVLPSIINGVMKLTAAGSPYRLRTPIRVATDGVLMVEPGVRLIVSPKARLTVQGELLMYGSANSPIVATDENDQGFNEFLVLQTTQPVHIAGLQVSGAGVPIAITAGTPLISDCTLADSFNALTISGSARPTIRNCEISGASTSGVIVSGQAQPLFEGNQFRNNSPFHIQNSSTYQINAAGNTWQPEASAMTVLGNVTY